MKRILLALLLFSSPVFADNDSLNSAFIVGNINAVCRLYANGNISKKVANQTIEALFELVEELPKEYIDKTYTFINTVNNGACREFAP